MNPTKRPTAPATCTPALRRRHGIALRQVSLAACLAATAPAGLALPQGEVPTFGEATVSRPAPGRMDIRQTTPRAGLDWTSFSIAAGERVVVQQPSRDAVLLNRVLGDDPSLIYGSLSSNGGVWLINPRGIVFGASSRIDVGSLVASTLAITQDDVASGRLQLGRGAGAGALRADGDIRADGSVVLVAPQLDIGGRITAPRVGLAAATEVLVDLDGDGLVFFNVRSDALESRLQMQGRVLADGGVADLRAAARAGLAGTVLNLEGVVQARTLGVREGRIVIDGGGHGVTRIAGTLDAQGHDNGARGGDVLVQGDRILLDRGARIDASGTAGGGSVRVGGDFRGANADVRNAAMVSVRAGALLDASATDLGDAGRVIVWSDEATRFAGHAAARGGARGGDGGLVEVSGKAFLDYRGSADLTAPTGRFGTLLLDPTNILIEASAPDLNDDGTAGDDLGPGGILFAGPGVNSRITAGALVSQLAAGNVELQASNDISVNAAVSSGSASSLTLRGGGLISISAPVTVGGDLTLSANDAGSSTRNPAGAVTVGAALSVGGALTLSNNGGAGVHALGANLSAGTLVLVGNAARTAGATWTLGGNSTVGSDITGNFPFTKAGAGSLVLTGTLAATTVTIDGGTLQAGNGGATGVIANTGTLTVNAAGTLAVNRSGSLDLSAAVANPAPIAGSGTFRVAGGTLTLDGALPTIGAVQVAAGTLVLAPPSDDRIADGAAVTVATGAVLDVGVAQEQVGSLSLGGSLAQTGIGTLVMGDLTLTSGGNLNIPVTVGGTITAASGTSQISSTTTGATVQVNGGATLTVGNAAAFSDTAAVTVATGGTLTLAVAKQAASLDLSGTLGGNTFALTASGGVTLRAGALVQTPTGGPSLTVAAGPGSATLQRASSAATVAVNTGTLVVGTGGSLADAAALTVAADATLQVDAADTIGSLSLAGTLSGAATLSVDTLTANGAAARIRGTLSVGTASTVASGTLTVGDGATAGALAGAGTLAVDTGATLSFDRDGPIALGSISGTGGTLRRAGGSGALTLNGTAPSITAVQVDAGSFVLADGNDNRLGNGASVAVASGATFTTGNQPERIGSLTLAGTLSGAGTLTAATYALQPGAVVGGAIGGGALTVSGAGSATLNAAAGVGSVDVGNGSTLVLGAASDLSGSADVTVSAGGTLTLGRNDTIDDLTLAGTLNGSFTLAAGGGTTFQGGGRIEFGTLLAGGTLTTTGDATLAGRYDGGLVRINNGAVLRLSVDVIPSGGHIADTSNMQLLSGGTIQLELNETVNQLTGSGTVLGPGQLFSNVYVLDDDSVNNLTTGTLVSRNASRINGNVSVTGTATVETGTLTVGNGNNGGTLSAGGGIVVSAGAVLAYSRNGTVAVAQAISGDGTLRQTGGNSGTGELQITGTASTAFVDIAGGTLSLGSGSGNRLSDTAVVTVASGQTLRLDNTGETIGTLNLAGTLSGAGTLTATTYSLGAGANASAALGTGTLNVAGNSTLVGTAGVGVVNVNAGTLTLGAANRFASTPTLAIAGGARLLLNGDEAAGSATIAGTLDRSAAGNRLVASAAELQAGASVVADLTGGPLTVTGNAAMSGASGAATVAVNAGTFTLGAPNVLANTASVTVAAGAGLAIGANAQSVGAFTSAGALTGSATLQSASGYVLEAGASVAANLGSGALAVNGNASLAGTAASATVDVNGGTFTLAGSNRLAAAAAVTVDAGATLALGGDLAVATLTLAGSVTGSGRTLTASTTTLGAGAQFGANLGPGALVVDGNAALSGTAASGTLVINAGTLTLGAANRFTAAPSATLTGTLATAGNEALGALAGSGDVTLGGGTLSAGGAADSSFSGRVLGSGNLRKTGSGTLQLSGASAYGGSTQVAQGVLRLTGDERLPDTTALTVDAGATLRADNIETVAQATIAGTLQGPGTLTAATHALNGGTVASGATLGAGTLTSTGSSQLAGRATAGTVQVNAGTLTLATADRLDDNANVTVAAGATLNLGAHETVRSLALAGTLDGLGFTLSTSDRATLQAGGLARANLGSGLLVVSGNAQLVGTSAAATVDVQAGTLSLAAAERLLDTANVTVAGGAALSLGGAERVGTLALAGTLAGASRLDATTVTLQSGALVQSDVAASSLLVQGNATLQGQALVGTAQISAGTLTLAAPERIADTAALTVAAGATLQLASHGETVASAALAGTLAGSGTLTAATYALGGATVDANLGSGALTSTGTTALNGTAAASSVTVTSGTLTLGAANRFTAAPSATLTGTLATAGNEALGALAGSGDVTLGGGTLSAGGAADSSFSGRVLGSGNLRKTGSGTLQLSGASAYGGSTQVAQGVLRLTGDERLPDTTALTVDAGATLRADNIETVAQATIAGTLQGPGTLTAATHALNGGTVASGATLGAGTLTSTGSSQLAGRATAGTVQVNAGTLTLATADRLDDNANVTVAAGATLNLGAHETVRSLALAGTLDGLGFTLSTSDRATLQAGGLARANLGSGLLVVSGNAQLVGTSAAATVDVQAGTLSLAAAERLLDTANVTVAGGAALSLGGAERVGTLALAGTLAGASRLDATTVTLQSGALVQSDVAASSLLVQGNATLQGQALVGTAQISAGTLTLAAPERIADTAALTVAAGATLQLASHGETVASAALAGTLAGSGTLTAATYALGGATVDANLGSGALTSTGTTALNGTAAASSVTVTSGTLTLGAANRLADATALTVATGATLALSGNDTVGSLSLSGTVGGSGTLTATGGYALAGGTLQATAALGAGSLASTGSSLLAGTAAANTVSVDSGTLALGSADRLADTAALTIAGGATLALGGNDRVGSLTLAGTLAGSGTLTAATYTLAGGTVDVPLGAGALSSSGSSRLNAAAGAATVTIGGGTLSTGGAALLADTAAVSVAPGATLRLGGTQTIGSLAGGGDVELGTATLTTGALASSSFDGRLLGSGGLVKAGAATTFSLGGANAYAGATQVLQGTLRTTAANALPDAGAFTVAAGATLELGGNDTVASLALAGRLAGTGTLSASTYALDGGTVDAPLGAGTLSSQGSSRLNRSAAAGSVDVVAGTLTLGSGNLLDDAALLRIAAGATLVLNGNDRVGAVDAAGTITGTGQLSAGSYLLTGGLYELDLGDGTLTSTGNSIFNGTSAATAVTVSSGQLTLLRANTFSAQPAVTVGAGAAMTLAGNETFGSLAGNGTLALDGATLVTGALGDSRFGGVVSGNGGSELRKVGAGVFTLAGNQGYTGTTRVDAGTLALEGTLASATIAVRGGTLALAGAERLADTATVTVATGATLALAGNETVGSLVLSGTLGGSGTLTAANTLLDGGTVDADLGPGALSSRALATLRGTSAAITLSVETGTLALASAGRLVATPAVGVAAGAALSLGGNETVGALMGDGLVALGGATLSTGALGDASFGGTLAGAGGGLVKLGTGTVTLAGASTYTGTTRVAAGTLAVAGTLASQTLRVDAGTLALGSADRLADSATLEVAAGALMTLAGNDTVGALQLAGRLAGSGTLSAATYALDGATVDADLGRGALSSRGAARLAGRSEAGTVSVTDGTLTLAAAGRLGALPATTVAAGATLAAAGDEALGSLAAAGTLSGSGTLSAATYALDGATVGIALGGGALASRGLTRLERPSAADSIAVDAGTLTLQPAALLTALPAVTLAGGTTLALGSDQALGLLAGEGTVSLGAATLTTGARGDSSFAGALAGSGGLVKAGSSRFVLSGASPYTGATRVAGGTLAIDGTLASAALQVDAGTLALGAAERLADGATLAVARGAALTLAGSETVAALQLAGRLHGNGTLIAATYALDGAVVEAELGRGTLSSRGTSRLDGRAGANSVAVDTGTLTLGAADRLADDAAISVAAGATLALGGNDTVASLALAGTLGGSGTLTAANYALEGGQALADLGAGRLSSNGSSTLAGRAAVGEILVGGGTLTLPAADRLSAAPAVNVAAGAALALGGSQTLGTLAGSGGVALGSHELATGSGGDGVFAGVISGTGGLRKLGGTSFTLTGANTYTGPTTVAAGTLRVGDGGGSGSLASSGYQLTGRLVFDRSDDVTLAQPVAGSGGVTQAGSGRLLLAGSNKTYAGSTLVERGELATQGDEQLPDASAVRVDAPGRLALGGRERLQSLDADGAVALAGDLAAADDLLMRGAVTVPGNQPLTLTGRLIDATHDGNRWGSSVAIDARGRVDLASGRDAGVARHLVLGRVTVPAGGRIAAGTLQLSDAVTVGGAQLELVSSGAATLTAPPPEAQGRQAAGLPIGFGADEVLQSGGEIRVAAGGGLRVVVASGASVRLLAAGNEFLGELSVTSGAAGSAWTERPTPGSFAGPTQNYALQGRVRIAGSTIVVGGSGIEADLVSVSADRLTTTGDARIVARLPFDNTVGTAASLPALTLELTPAAFGITYPYGQPGAEIRVDIGSRAFGNRTLPLDAGYLTMLPRGGASGSTAVLLSGPQVALGGYRFFFDGAGRQGEIPVFYNGLLPVTPAVENSISATVSVSESARKQRFEEAVRTENVALRLRAGVIAEVGPGRSATTGSQGLRLPTICPPAGASLGCGPTN